MPCSRGKIVSLTDRLFGRPAGAKLDLAVVQAKLAASARASAVPDAALTRARLADHFRDAGLVPVLPEEFDRAVAGLDAEAERRLGVLVSLLELEPVRAVFAHSAAPASAGQLVSAALIDLARETALLTIEVLSQSEQRVEELARRFFGAIRANISGETAEESKKRLHKLDYGRLLEEAEKARTAAAERAERLRQLQEQQEQRRGRRGKW
jgi:hypothetical protein